MAGGSCQVVNWAEGPSLDAVTPGGSGYRHYGETSGTYGSSWIEGQVVLYHNSVPFSLHCWLLGLFKSCIPSHKALAI